jgi:hypothetical protein
MAPHLVNRMQRLGRANSQVRSFGRPPTLWWLLDVRGSGSAAKSRFDDIRGGEQPRTREVDRSTIPRRLPRDEIGGRGFKGADEFAPDYLALGSGSLNGERVEKLVDGIDSRVTSRTPVEAT